MRKLVVSLGCLILSSTCLAQTANWVQLKPTNTPGPRVAHSMVYERAQNRSLLFGGYQAPVGETWTLDHLRMRWTKHSPSKNPGNRWDAPMSYDERGKSVQPSRGPLAFWNRRK